MHFIPFRQNMNDLTVGIENILGNKGSLYGTYSNSVEVLTIKTTIENRNLITIFECELFQVKTYSDYFREYCENRYINQQKSTLIVECPHFLEIGIAVNQEMYSEIFKPKFVLTPKFFVALNCS